MAQLTFASLDLCDEERANEAGFLANVRKDLFRAGIRKIEPLLQAIIRSIVADGKVADRNSELP